jgi:translation initiation factor IF-1
MFYKRTNNKILRGECKDCVRRNTAAYKEAHPDYWTKNGIERRRSAQLFVFDYLTTHPCVDCGETDPLVLEFDHIQSVLHGRVTSLLSYEKIVEEIARCEVRCSNCHTRITHTRGHTERYKMWLTFTKDMVHAGNTS